MIRRANRFSRRGFSLLEVLLASVIAVLLLSGLYVAMDVQLRQAEAGRDVVHQATLVRAIVQKVSLDLAPSIGVIASVKSSSSSSSSGSGSSSSGSGSGSSSSGSGSTGSSGASSSGSSGSSSMSSSSSGSSSSSSGSSSSSSSGSSSSSSSTGSTSTATFTPSQAGLIGDGSSVSIYAANVANGSTQSSNSAGDPPPTAPDVRLVSYAVTDGGLVRTEQGFVTADGSNSDNVTTTVIADEVTQIQFQYWDGTTWSSAWDGSTLSDDGLTPIGPPMAIEMKIWIKQSKKADPKMFRHVIALNTGMNPATQNQTTTTPMQ